MNEFYLIAKILSSGKNGFVKIQFEPGVAENIESLKFLFLDFWDKKKKFELEEISTAKQSVFFKLKNFDDERDISVLVGRSICVVESDLKKLHGDSSLSQNLIGYKVFKGNNFLGSISSYFQTPANPVIEIKNNDGKEILIPFVHSLFDKIDPESKVLILKSDYGIDEDDED